MRIRIQTTTERVAVKTSDDGLVRNSAPVLGQFRRPVRSWATEFERFEYAGVTGGSSDSRDARKDEGSKNRQ